MKQHRAKFKNMSVNVFGDLPQKNHTSTGGDEAVFSLECGTEGFFPPKQLRAEFNPKQTKKKKT